MEPARLACSAHWRMVEVFASPKERLRDDPPTQHSLSKMALQNVELKRLYLIITTKQA